MSIKLHGKVSLWHYRDGVLLRYVDPTVVFTDAGHSAISDCISNSSSRPDTFEYIAIGSDSTAPSTSDTALGSELDRESATYTKVNDYSYELESTFTAGGTWSVWETGVFNASTGGTLLARCVLDSSIDLEQDDQLTVTWTISHS